MNFKMSTEQAEYKYYHHFHMRKCLPGKEPGSPDIVLRMKFMAPSAAIVAALST
jgi:hypothetical protein